MPRSVLSSAASVAPSPCIPRRRTQWLRRPHRTRPRRPPPTRSTRPSRRREAPLQRSPRRSPRWRARSPGASRLCTGSPPGPGRLRCHRSPPRWLTSRVGHRRQAAARRGGGGLGSGSGAACAPASSDPGLGCVLGSLTTALGTVGSLPPTQAAWLDTVDPSLAEVITAMTGTLANLSSLLPIASLPLPPGGVSAGGHPGPGRAARYEACRIASGASSLLSTTGLASGTGEISSLLGGVTGGGVRRHRVGGTLAAPTSPRQWRRREWRLDHRRDHRAWSARNLDEWHDGDSSDEERHQHTDERYDGSRVAQPARPARPTTSTTSTTTTTR